MAEYIEREFNPCDVCDYKRCSNCVLHELAMKVVGHPAADVAPVVHGRWIVTEEYNDVIEMDVVKYACSACGEYRLSATTLSQATNYCPNCGARMDGE